MGAGQAGEEPEEGQRCAGFRLGREVEAEGHVGAGLAAGMAQGELGAAEGSGGGKGFEGHSFLHRRPSEGWGPGE